MHFANGRFKFLQKLLWETLPKWGVGEQANEDINVIGRKEEQGKTSRTNREVRVDVDAAGAIRLRRVSGFNGHLATIDIPASLVVLLGVGNVSLSGAPATDDRCNDQAEEDDP